MLWERLFIVSHVLAASILVVAGLTIVVLLYGLGEILKRTKGRYYALITDEGPELHTPLPPFEGCTCGGEVVRNSDFVHQEFALLFVSPGCTLCKGVLAAVEPVRRSRIEPPTFVVITECSASEAQAYLQGFQFEGVVVADPEGEIASRLGLVRAPYGILVDGHGIVRMKGVLNHRSHLEALVARRGRSVSSTVWDRVADPEVDAERARIPIRA